MTEFFETAVAVARELPADRQDEIARVVLALVHEDLRTYQFTPDEAAEEVIADAEEARGDYATDEEVRAIWAKHGL